MNDDPASVTSNPRAEMRGRMLADEERSEQAFEELSLRIALEAHEDRLKLWEDVERLTRENTDLLGNHQRHMDVYEKITAERDRLRVAAQRVVRLQTDEDYAAAIEALDAALSDEPNSAPETGAEQAMELYRYIGNMLRSDCEPATWKVLDRFRRFYPAEPQDTGSAENGRGDV